MFDDGSLVLVAVTFGVVMGWGMGRFTDDRIPLIVSLGAAVAIGAVMWMAAGPDLEPAAVSLLLGGASGLLGLLPSARRAGT